MKRWSYTPMNDVDQTLVERLRNFPREPDMLVSGLRSSVALIIRAWLRIYHRFEVSGQEHLSRDESFVLVANHCSHLDTLCLLSALPLHKLHRAFPAAAADYFFQNVPRTWVAAVVVNALPFARQINIRHSMTVCSELLSNHGNILIIFPEGTRSTTGETQTFKGGIGALVAGRNIKVLPCYLRGAFHAWPKGRMFPRPRKIQLMIGPPRSYVACSSEKASVRAIAEELREAVRLLGEKNGAH